MHETPPTAYSVLPFHAFAYHVQAQDFAHPDDKGLLWWQQPKFWALAAEAYRRREALGLAYAPEASLYQEQGASHRFGAVSARAWLRRVQLVLRARGAVAGGAR